MHSVLGWLSIVAGLLSGALWLYAARIKVPMPAGVRFGGTIAGVEGMTAGFKKQADWNGYAAIATAAAEAFQAAATWIA